MGANVGQAGALASLMQVERILAVESLSPMEGNSRALTS